MAAGGLLSVLVRRPELVARLGLLDGDRRGLLDEPLERAALRQVALEIVEAPGLLEARAQLLGLGVLARGAGLQRVEDVALAGLDVLLVDDGGDDRLAAQRLLGLGLGLLEELLLALAGDLEVGLAVDALVAERVQHALPLLLGARGDELLGHVDLGLLDHGVED